MAEMMHDASNRGVAFYERQAAEVTEIGLREIRQGWLPVLEELRAKADNHAEQGLLDGELLHLRRLLGLVPDGKEARRPTIRERVRQHRERKKQGIELRPHLEPVPVTAETIAAELKRQADVWLEIGRIKQQG
jgi:hypothetical protein